MNYKEHYSDEEILELCNDFGIDPNSIDKKEIEENMLDFCNENNIDISQIDINQVEKDLLESMQRLGMDLTQHKSMRKLAQYHGVLETGISTKNKAGKQ